MAELGDTLIYASGTMHIWARPAVMALFGIVYWGFDTFLMLMGEK